MDATPQRPPFEMAGYEVLRRIGRGAYGDVWLARTAVGGLYRAIKVVYRDRFPEGSRAFETEFKGLERFTQGADRLHRQLAILHAVMQPAGDVFYYVMELADDVERREGLDPATYRPLTLQALRAQGFGDARKWLRLAVDLADALVELHDVVDVAHRDIKPNNLIIVSGHLKIADIGLVTSTAEMASGQGTPDYLAPPDGNQTKADDIWCAGKVLYFMLFGTIKGFPSGLFDPENGLIFSDPLFKEINEVIDRACQPDPADRPTAAELAADLKTIDSGESILPDQSLRRRLAAMRRYASVAATAAVVLAAAFATWVVVDVLRERLAAVELERQERSLGFLQMAVDATSRGNGKLAQHAMSNALAAYPEGTNSFEYRVASRGVEGIMPRAAWTHVFAQGEVPVGLAIQQDGASLAVLAHPGGYGRPGTTGVVEVFRGPEWRAAARFTNALFLGQFLPNTGEVVVQDDQHRIGARSAASTRALAMAPTNNLDGMSRDGRYALFAAWSADPSRATLNLYLWDATTGSKAAPWNGGADVDGWSLDQRVVSPSGNRVAAVFRDGGPLGRTRIVVWERDNPVPLSTNSNLSRIWSMAFSPDDLTLAVAAQGEPIRLLDVSTGQPRLEIEPRQAEVRCVSFSPDSQRVAFGDAQGWIGLADVGSADRRLGFVAHEGPVNALEWFPDGKRFASVGEDRTAKVWDVDDVGPSSSLENLWKETGRGFMTLASSSNVVVTTREGSVAWVQWPSKVLVRTFTNVVHAVARGDSGLEFYALDPSNRLLTADLSSGRTTGTGLGLGTNSGALYGYAASPDNRFLVVITKNGTSAKGGSEPNGGSLLIWNLKARTVVTNLAVPSSEAVAIAFSSDARFVLLAGVRLDPGGKGATVRQMDLANGNSRDLDVGTLDGEITSMTMSPDGSWLVAGLKTGVIQCIRLSNPGGKPRLLVGHQGRVFALAFSPDGSRLMSGGDDGFVVAWSVREDFRRLVRFPVDDRRTPEAGDPAVDALSFSDDGQTLWVWANSTLRCWRAAQW